MLFHRACRRRPFPWTELTAAPPRPSSSNVRVQGPDARASVTRFRPPGPGRGGVSWLWPLPRPTASQPLPEPGGGVGQRRPDECACARLRRGVGRGARAAPPRPGVSARPISQPPQRGADAACGAGYPECSAQGQLTGVWFSRRWRWRRRRRRWRRRSRGSSTSLGAGGGRGPNPAPSPPPRAPLVPPAPRGTCGSAPGGRRVSDPGSPPQPARRPGRSPRLAQAMTAAPASPQQMRDRLLQAIDSQSNVSTPRATGRGRVGPGLSADPVLPPMSPGGLAGRPPSHGGRCHPGRSPAGPRPWWFARPAALGTRGRGFRAAWTEGRTEPGRASCPWLRPWTSASPAPVRGALSPL